MFVFVMQIFTLMVATRYFVLLFSLKVLSAMVLMRELKERNLILPALSQTDPGLKEISHIVKNVYIV